MDKFQALQVFVKVADCQSFAGAAREMGISPPAVTRSVSMLEEADRGIFFQAPDNVRAEYPQYPLANDYDELRDLIAV